jgi:hypothetical protein
MDIELVKMIESTLTTVGVIVILIMFIRMQQEQLNGLKSQIESMKTYVAIFNVDEFKKYADFAAENAKNAALKEFSIDAPDVIREIIRETNEASAGSPNP